MDCKTLWTTEKHIVLLCNKTASSPTTTYSAIESTTTNIPATTTVPTTAYPTTSFQEKQETTLPSTTTPLPSLRGSTTTARTEYIQPKNELEVKNITNLEALQEANTKYIYVTSNQTENMARPQDLTALWIAFSILLVLVIGLAVKQHKQTKNVQRKPSVVPEEKKNRNSWSQEPYMSRRNPLHSRRIPKEHRKSMEAVRQQLKNPPSRAPPVPPIPPRPEVAKMKMREVVQSKRGVERLKYQMDKLKEIQKGINGTPNTSNE